LTRKGRGGRGCFVCLDKAPGPTSFDLVRRVRSVTGYRRVGHAGTLDPFASGLLVVATGSATRLLQFISLGEKRYAATVRFGAATDTDDATGRVIAEGEMAFTREALASTLAGMVGIVTQRPPDVSAIKVGGRRAYALQRAGELPGPLPARPVRIRGLELVRFAPPFADLIVECGSGTYVRSLARDLGAELGCPAHLYALRRERSGTLTLADATGIDAFERGWDGLHVAGPGVLSPADALRGVRRLPLSPPEVVAVRHGRCPAELGQRATDALALAGALPAADTLPAVDTLPASGALPIALVDGGGELIALAQRRPEGLALWVVIPKDGDGDVSGTV
jgi:tRNA pseudouridine55 synthase